MSIGGNVARCSLLVAFCLLNSQPGNSLARNLFIFGDVVEIIEITYRTDRATLFCNKNINPSKITDGGTAWWDQTGPIILICSLLLMQVELEVCKYNNV
jgi:hypothetical protein